MELYINLEMQANFDDERRLVRKVSKEYLQKTFGELLEKVADKETDEFHLNPYNGNELKYANNLQRILEDANTEPGSVGLIARSIDTPPEEIQVSLFDKISEYNDRIISSSSDLDEEGKAVNYNKIDLYIFQNISGGLEQDYFIEEN